MRQLLMLNDQVEELKWQRRRQQRQRNALLSSSCATPSVDDVDCSDTEYRWSRTPNTPDSWSRLALDRPSRLDDDDDDEEATTLKYPTPSALSLLRYDDRLSDSGSVDALDLRAIPDTPEVFPATPQSAAGPRTAAARPSPPKKPSGRTPGDGEQAALKSTESKTTDQCVSTFGVDHKSARSPTKTKEQDLHSTNSDSFQDFCTYVEMLI